MIDSSSPLNMNSLEELKENVNLSESQIDSSNLTPLLLKKHGTIMPTNSNSKL